MTERNLPPAEVVREYVTRTWNEQDPSALTEFLAEPCWRHDTGNPEAPFKKFTAKEQAARAQEGYATGSFDFQIVELIEAGEFVTMIWNLDYIPASQNIKEHLLAEGALFDDRGNVMMKGIEVFRVRNGKIIETWVAQTAEFKGHWGETMTNEGH